MEILRSYFLYKHFQERSSSFLRTDTYTAKNWKSYQNNPFQFEIMYPQSYGFEPYLSEMMPPENKEIGTVRVNSLSFGDLIHIDIYRIKGDAIRYNDIINKECSGIICPKNDPNFTGSCHTELPFEDAKFTKAFYCSDGHFQAADDGEIIGAFRNNLIVEKQNNSETLIFVVSQFHSDDETFEKMIQSFKIF